MALAVGAAAAAPPGPEAEALIAAAGSTDDDALRLEALKKLAALPGLSAELRADAEKMAALADRWIHDRSLWKWFDREVRKTADYQAGIAPDSPLYPLVQLYRGRMLFWVVNEYGNVIGYSESRRPFLDKAVSDFQGVTKAFPKNRLARMYLGEAIPWTKQLGEAAGAPRWAVLQREGLERLADIVHWWIDHRLQPNGEYGGAWDDDCEMWRHWVPVMIAFEDPKITKAQAFFSEALLAQDYMREGYTLRTYDVEHTAEPSSDTILPMMHLAPDDPAWQRRARRLAEFMERVWTGTNERGQLQFKSTYFNAQRVDPNPKRACDTPYCVVSVLPALLLWQRTADPQLGRLFTRWTDTWVEAAARGEADKPAGVIPAAIHWPDGVLKGPGPQWWDPQHHDEPRLYQWPAAVEMLCDLLLLSWHMSGREEYLQPLRSMAEVRRQALAGRGKSAAEGSLLWCGAKLSFLARTLAKYKLLSGSTEFDGLIARDYGALDLAADDASRTGLVRGLDQAIDGFRVNFAAFTSEVRFTDRVLAFARMYGRDMMFAEPVPANNKTARPDLLYATATGDRGSFSVFPLNAVRWLTPPREIAALVTHSSRREFQAELFHFGDQPRKLDAELYLLGAGRYVCEVRAVEGDRLLEGPTPLSVNGPRAKVALTLPPRQLCRVRIVAEATR